MQNAEIARLSRAKIEIRISLVNNSALWQNRHIATTSVNK